MCLFILEKGRFYPRYTLECKLIFTIGFIFLWFKHCLKVPLSFSIGETSMKRRRISMIFPCTHGRRIEICTSRGIGALSSLLRCSSKLNCSDSSCRLHGFFNGTDVRITLRMMNEKSFQYLTAPQDVRH